jgi:hypothetical protein
MPSPSAIGGHRSERCRTRNHSEHLTLSPSTAAEVSLARLGAGDSGQPTRCRLALVTTSVLLPVMLAAGKAEIGRGIRCACLSRRRASCRHHVLLRRGSRLFPILLPRRLRKTSVPNPSSNPHRVWFRRSLVCVAALGGARVKSRFETPAPRSFGHPNGALLEARTP